MIVAICGKAASGKKEICKELNKRGYKKIVTLTTRPRRNNEVEGVDYKFVSNDEFYRHIKNNEFAEWVRYNGFLYGSLYEDYNDYDSDLVVILTPEGIESVKKIIATNFCSFYVKENYQVRKQKMTNNGISDKEISSRRTEDRKRHFKNFIVDYVVDYNNQDLEDALLFIEKHAKITNYEK